MKIIDCLEVKQTNNELAEFGGISHYYANLADIRKVANDSMMVLTPLEYFDMTNATKDAMFYGDDKELVKKSINNLFKLLRIFT